MAAHYPTVIGVGAFQSSAASINHTIGGSTTPRLGDLILIFLESENQTFNPVVGYSTAPSSPQGRGTAAAIGSVRLTIFYKFSNGTETTYATGDSGAHNAVASMIIRGVNRIDPFDGNNGTTSSATSVVTCPAVTTTRPECLIINAIATDRDANTTTQFSNPVNNNLSNFVERIDGTTSTGNGGGLGIFTAEKSTAGDTGSTTVTQATSDEYGAITLAIAPLRRKITIT
jgi:hypothetical protein